MARRPSPSPAVLGAVVAVVLISIAVWRAGTNGDDVPVASAPTTTETSSTTTTSEEPMPPATTSTTAAAATTEAPTTTTTTPTTTTSRPSALADVAIRLTTVADRDGALDLAVRPGDRSLYVVFQDGIVGRVSDGTVTTVLDISAMVTNRGERGLLGAAFSPDGKRLYVHYSDTSGDTNVDEFTWSNGRADAASRRVVLEVDQPYANHNGGKITFGPDGFLYLGLGDGGGSGDPDNRAQRLDTLLGKLLRIDPTTPSGSLGYRIPSSNPFVGRTGARGEIWSFGLRNPYRFSFDSHSGDLWIGDVGQDAVEEIDWAPAPGLGRGDNYGWRLMEGNQRYGGPAPTPYHGPIWVYSRDGGRCAVTGGSVYRGAAVPSLHGVYVYADFCDGRLIGLRRIGTDIAESRDLGVSEPFVAGIVEGPDGELYVLSLGGPIMRIDPT